MFKHFDLKLLLLIGCVVPIAGCGNTLVDTISVTPTSQSAEVGQTAQFTATGTTAHGTHSASTQNITSQVTWASSVPAVATIDSSGLATGVAPGTTTITATMNGFGGAISATATLTVTGIGGTGTAGSSDITSVNIIPSTQSVASPGGTSQFIPIGATSAGASVNLSGLVAWSSSSTQIGTVNSAGVATAVSQGSTTISALYTNPDKSVATGTATFQVLQGNAEAVTALTMFPTAQAATAAAQQSQFTVLGTETGLQYDVTNQVAWTSSNPAVASVGTNGNGTPGLAKALSAGTTTIEATFTNSDGSKVVATGSYSVTIGAIQEPLLSINVVPAGTTVSNKGMTGQYLAFGTFSTVPTVRDITNDPNLTWISLLPEVASIDSYGASGGSGSGGSSGEFGGLATAQGYTGSSVIYAEYANPDGTVVLSNSQTFTCKDPNTNVCDQSVATPQFATVTVFVEGENTSPTGEFVTAPSDTGTANLIHCGPDWTGSGGQVCTGTYETGSTVVLTENLPAGSSYFGGWSAGDGQLPTNTCQEAGSPPSPTILATSTTCTLTLTGNASVGVIFY
jgi:hypothetical protein